MTKKETETTVKTSRVSQTRAKNEKPKVWAPPSSLDAPPAPEGFRHRWLRAESMGEDDARNISGKIRSGWEFVRADEYPGTDFPVIENGKYAGLIGVGGLVLARISEELAQSREAYFNNKTKEREDAVQNDVLKEQHPSMKFSRESNTRVTFGGTKKD